MIHTYAIVITVIISILILLSICLIQNINAKMGITAFLLCCLGFTHISDGLSISGFLLISLAWIAIGVAEVLDEKERSITTAIAVFLIGGFGVAISIQGYHCREVPDCTTMVCYHESSGQKTIWVDTTMRCTNIDTSNVCFTTTDNIPKNRLVICGSCQQRWSAHHNSQISLEQHQQIVEEEYQEWKTPPFPD